VAELLLLLLLLHEVLLFTLGLDFEAGFSSSNLWNLKGGRWPLHPYSFNDVN